jgi:hypothetical protein
MIDTRQNPQIAGQPRSDRRLKAADLAILGDQSGNRWLAACRLCYAINARRSNGLQRVFHEGRPALVIGTAHVIGNHVYLQVIEEGDLGFQTVDAENISH